MEATARMLRPSDPSPNAIPNLSKSTLISPFDYLFCCIPPSRCAHDSIVADDKLVLFYFSLFFTFLFDD